MEYFRVSNHTNDNLNLNDESIDSLSCDLNGSGDSLCIRGSSECETTQGVSFSKEEVESCDLLHTLWEQYRDTDESVVLPLPHTDLMYAQELLQYTHEKKPSYKTNTSPLVDSIGTQLNDTWYDVFFSLLTIKRCVSLHRTCEYIGALDITTILVKHVAHQLNICEMNQKLFLGMI